MNLCLPAATEIGGNIKYYLLLLSNIKLEILSNFALHKLDNIVSERW